MRLVSKTLCSTFGIGAVSVILNQLSWIYTQVDKWRFVLFVSKQVLCGLVLPWHQTSRCISVASFSSRIHAGVCNPHLHCSLQQTATLSLINKAAIVCKYAVFHRGFFMSAPS